MTKQDFLRELENSLQGRLAAGKIRENLQYYDTYIEEQKAAGMSEEEVLAQLGDASLIAQSILAASGADADAGNADGGNGRQEFGGYSYSDIQFGRKGPGRNWMGHIDFSKWYWKLAAAVIVIAVAVLVLSIVFGILKLLFYIAVPVIAVIAVIAAIEYLKDRR